VFASSKSVQQISKEKESQNLNDIKIYVND
jgi:hypothetical protein